MNPPLTTLIFRIFCAVPCVCVHCIACLFRVVWIVRANNDSGAKVCCFYLWQKQNKENIGWNQCLLTCVQYWWKPKPSLSHTTNLFHKMPTTDTTISTHTSYMLGKYQNFASDPSERIISDCSIVFDGKWVDFNSNNKTQMALSMVWRALGCMVVIISFLLSASAHLLLVLLPINPKIYGFITF